MAILAVFCVQDIPSVQSKLCPDRYPFPIKCDIIHKTRSEIKNKEEIHCNSNSYDLYISPKQTTHCCHTGIYDISKVKSIGFDCITKNEAIEQQFGDIKKILGAGKPIDNNLRKTIKDLEQAIEGIESQMTSVASQTDQFPDSQTNKL